MRIRAIFLILFFFGLSLLLSGCNKLIILDPKGMIATDEKYLMMTSILLMLIVVVPVIILTFAFAWRYRASNTKANYSPGWSHSTLLEVIWWSIPCVIIIALGIMTWTSSHRLDPYKPLNVPGKPLIIEAIALQWKWLFIYPEQNIATINILQIPVNVPIRFHITAEGPMNSFHIPQLSGQIYAMAGMQTKLNLIANEIGTYQGLSANYSGRGFSDMKFNVKTTSQAEFNEWVNFVKAAKNTLTMDMYKALVRPSEKEAITYFSSTNPFLFDTILMNSMMPAKDVTNLCNAKLSMLSKK